MTLCQKDLYQSVFQEFTYQGLCQSKGQIFSFLSDKTLNNRTGHVSHEGKAILGLVAIILTFIEASLIKCSFGFPVLSPAFKVSAKTQMDH